MVLCRQVRHGVAAQKELEERSKSGTALDPKTARTLEGAVRAARYAEAALVRENMALIVSLATKISRRVPGVRVERDDVLQAATLGFLIGLRHFDPDKGFRLSTFVAFHVKEYVLRLYRDAPIVSGSYGGELAVGLRRLIAAIELETGSTPTAEQLAEAWNHAMTLRFAAMAAGAYEAQYGEEVEYDEALERGRNRVVERGIMLTPERVRAVLARAQGAESLDRPWHGDEDDATLADAVSDGVSAEDAAAARIESDERRHQIAEMFERIGTNPHTKFALELLTRRFGLGGRPPESVEEIARSHKKSVAEVNEMLEHALTLLRQVPDVIQMAAALETP